MSDLRADRLGVRSLFSIRSAVVASARTLDPEGRFGDGDGCLVRNVQPIMSGYLRRFPACPPSRSVRAGFVPDRGHCVSGRSRRRPDWFNRHILKCLYFVIKEKENRSFEDHLTRLPSRPGFRSQTRRTPAASRRVATGCAPDPVGGRPRPDTRLHSVRLPGRRSSGSIHR